MSSRRNAILTAAALSAFLPAKPAQAEYKKPTSEETGELYNPPKVDLLGQYAKAELNSSRGDNNTGERTNARPLDKETRSRRVGAAAAFALAVAGIGKLLSPPRKRN